MCSVLQEGQEPLRESEMYNIANLRPTSVVALFAMIDKVRAEMGAKKCLQRVSGYR